LLPRGGQRCLALGTERCQRCGNLIFGQRTARDGLPRSILGANALAERRGLAMHFLRYRTEDLRQLRIIFAVRMIGRWPFRILGF
jgi:hypothetical protein